MAADGFLIANTFNSVDGTPYIAVYGKRFRCIEYDKQDNVNLEDKLYPQCYLYSTRSAAQAQVTRCINNVRRNNFIAEESWKVLQVSNSRIVM